ncbi:unnamed protein product [Darwinula stevensoni]|uniref:Glucose-fructose oxidoreductase domain-containing protein 1 n=1 Tax=Darwinula stevensoni TaxID=69355 RepID=A0A7R9AA74_9CRUS|nr:unnamed protein product [Darwinula stevensoni]CAG0898153.1 unnamed protein product [Darwinula stevensoni]
MLPGIGVFGMGELSCILVPLLRAKGFNIEAIWEKSTEEAEAAAKKLEIPFSSSNVDDLLLHKDVDLVLITCSPNVQAQIAVKAMGIGKHVLCDRPGGINQHEALKMVNAAMYYPSLISVVNYGLRYLPACSVMKKLIHDGFCGQVQLCEAQIRCGSLLPTEYNWKWDGIMGGGTLTLLGSHIIDLVSYITDQRPWRVHGMVHNYIKVPHGGTNGVHQVTSDDYCTFQMELSQGVCVNVTLSSRPGESFFQEISVYGDAGSLTIRGVNLFGRKNQTPDKEELLHMENVNLDPRNSLCDNPRPHILGMNKLIGALRDAFTTSPQKKSWRKDPLSLAATFHDGQYVQATIEAIKKSSKERRWVRVDLLTEEPNPNRVLNEAVRRGAISL